MPDARSPRVWLAVAWSVFNLYTAYAGMYDLLIQLPVHVAFAVALGFLTAPLADSPQAPARLAPRAPRPSLAAAGRTQGGAGKVAVISSGLFGTVNGSAIANAVTTGAFTIPLMKRAGYRPAFAAGVEACASMGGQLIPPVMGAAAFIMAETLQVPYGTIAFAATIPGILYFVAVGAMVHFEAARAGLPVLPRSALPRLGAVLRRDVHLVAGPAVLVWFLVDGRSPLFAGFWALVSAFALSQLRPDTRIGAQRILAVLHDSAHSAMPVALACATVGIVVGVVSATGLGLKLAGGIVNMAGRSMLATLALTMIAALVLGTGLPTSATYIITSIMAAPAPAQPAIPKLVAHMFVFYFGILADLTPPTAISTYATSSIAGADVWKTQWTAMLLALSGFIIPFSFAYDPALLMLDASPLAIAWRTLAATVGILMLAAGIIGYLSAPARPWERAVLLAGALLLILPGAWSDAAGLAAFGVVYLSQRRRGVAVGAISGQKGSVTGFMDLRQWRGLLEKNGDLRRIGAEGHCDSGPGAVAR